MGFQKVGSKVLVSKKCLNTAGRGIISQSRIHIFKNFLGSCPETHSFQYLLLSQLECIAGYRDNVHEMIQITSTISSSEACCKR